MNNQISLIPGYEYEPPVVHPGRQKLQRPQVMYGLANNGKTCASCEHCCSYTQSRRWYKCSEWSESHSQATDIRLKWPACGRYQDEQGVKVEIVKQDDEGITFSIDTRGQENNKLIKLLKKIGGP